MPRIEIIPAGWDKSKEKARGDGAPTVETCFCCAHGVGEGDKIEILGSDDLSEKYPNAVLGSVDVDHPLYEDNDYDGDMNCVVCGEPLCADDN